MKRAVNEVRRGARSLLAVLLLAGLLPAASAHAAAPAEGGASASADSTTSADSSTSADASSSADAAASADAASGNDELERTLAEVIAGEEQSAGARFSVYGFSDLNYIALVDTDESTRVVSGIPERGFIAGNINLYFEFHPSSLTRALIETRLTSEPNGQQLSLAVPAARMAYSRTNTEFLDKANGFRTDRWGSTIIERAEMQFLPLDQLNVAAGIFLTPIGIWSLDHGSPARLTIRPPAILTRDLFPLRQLGVRASGRMDVGDYEVSYVATLSNGRGPADLQFDMNADLATGARLLLRSRGALPFELGASWFRGRVSDVTRGVASASPIVLYEEVAYQYEEQTLGADLRLEWGSLLVAAEALYGTRRYVEGKRRPVPAPVDLGEVTPDTEAWGGYLQLGYRLPLWGQRVTPFGVYSFSQGVADFAIEPRIKEYSFGARVHIADSLFFKCAGTVVDPDGFFGVSRWTAIETQLSMGF